jgi:hypothetical protein
LDKKNSSFNENFNNINLNNNNFNSPYFGGKENEKSYELNTQNENLIDNNIANARKVFKFNNNEEYSVNKNHRFTLELFSNLNIKKEESDDLFDNLVSDQDMTPLTKNLSNYSQPLNNKLALNNSLFQKSTYSRKFIETEQKDTFPTKRYKI